MNLLNGLLMRAQTTPTDVLYSTELPDAVNNIITLPAMCKAAELDMGESASGLLEVHLLNSIDSKWYKMPLLPGERNSCIFDKIRTTGTTVTLSKVSLFPLEIN